jgi:hypothetical protein
LLANALKYTRRREMARIDIGCRDSAADFTLGKAM